MSPTPRGRAAEAAVGGGLQLTVVGPAAAWTRRRGRPASSSYLVELWDGPARRGGPEAPEAILLDLGQGSFAALGRIRPPETLLAVFVSHLHPDHHADLVPLRHYLQYALPEPCPVELVAPRGIRERYDAFLGEGGFLDVLPGPELVAGTIQVGAFTVEAARVTHTDSSYAFRVTRTAAVTESAAANGRRRLTAKGWRATTATGTDGPSGAEGSGPTGGRGGVGRTGLVYSGDCGWPEDLLPLIRPGDTLLCEAAWGSGTKVAGVWHLTAREAAVAARDGGASRLILTHVLDENTRGTARAAAEVFDGQVLVARPGLVVTVA